MQIYVSGLVSRNPRDTPQITCAPNEDREKCIKHGRDEDCTPIVRFRHRLQGVRVGWRPDGTPQWAIETDSITELIRKSNKRIIRRKLRRNPRAGVCRLDDR